MMGHQFWSYKPENGQKRYFFCDNYYTRHVLAEKLKVFCDDGARMIGTVKFTNVDATNRYYLSQAIEKLKDSPRGTWCIGSSADLPNLSPRWTKLTRRVTLCLKTPR